MVINFRSMIRLASIFIGWSCLFISARADLILEQEVVDTNGTSLVTMSLQGNKLRMDQQNAKGDRFSVLIDLTTRDATTLIPQKKKFSRRSGREMQLRIKHLPKSFLATNEVFQLPAKAVDTGKTELVNGVATKIYTWTGARGLTETLWVATPFPNYDAIRPELAKMDRFNDGGIHPNMQPHLSELPGMAMKAESVWHGNTNTIQLISVKVEPLSPSSFEVPADYVALPLIATVGTNATASPHK